MQQGRTSPLSLSRGDRTDSQNTKGVAVEREGKGNSVDSIDVSRRYERPESFVAANQNPTEKYK
jgi:hypothetical protein